MGVNMKVVLLFFMLTSFSGGGFCQSMDKVFSGKTNCIEIDLQALEIIPALYESNALDSIELVLDFVSYKCMESASLRLTRFLLLIQQHRFSDTLLSPLDLHYINKEAKHLVKNHLMDFEQFSDSQLGGPSINLFFKRPFIEARYIAMLKNWTASLAVRPDNTPLEQSIIMHMMPGSAEKSGSSLWVLANPKKGYPAFAQQYHVYHRDYIMFRSWQLTIGAGMWMPTGQLKKIMGNKTSLAFSAGKNFGKGKNRIDFSGNFILGKSARPFTIVNPDTSFISNDGYLFFGQLDYVRNVWRPNRFIEWNILAGIGVAEKGIYNYLNENESEENDPAEQINTKMGPAFLENPVLSAGSEFKYFFSSGVAVNLQCRYQFYNLGSIGKVSFSGNSVFISAGLTIHFGGHPASGAVSVSSWR